MKSSLHILLVILCLFVPYGIFAEDNPKMNAYGLSALYSVKESGKGIQWFSLRADASGQVVFRRDGEKLQRLTLTRPVLDDLAHSIETEIKRLDLVSGEEIADFSGLAEEECLHLLFKDRKHYISGNKARLPNSLTTILTNWIKLHFEVVAAS